MSEQLQFGKPIPPVKLIVSGFGEKYSLEVRGTSDPQKIVEALSKKLSVPVDWWSKSKTPGGKKGKT